MRFLCLLRRAIFLCHLKIACEIKFNLWLGEIPLISVLRYSKNSNMNK